MHRLERVAFAAEQTVEYQITGDVVNKRLFAAMNMKFNTATAEDIANFTDIDVEHEIEQAIITEQIQEMDKLFLEFLEESSIKSGTEYNPTEDSVTTTINEFIDDIDFIIVPPMLLAILQSESRRNSNFKSDINNPIDLLTSTKLVGHFDNIPIYCNMYWPKHQLFIGTKDLSEVQTILFDDIRFV